MKLTFKKIMGIVLLCAGLTGYVIAEEKTGKMSDVGINAIVKEKISSAKILDGASIKVKTINAVVELSGSVDSDTQASAATQIAQSVMGVKNVETKGLMIKQSEHPVQDALITAKIKGMYVQQELFGDKDISSMSIKVETVDGIVTLSGNAENKDQAMNAEKIAKSVMGVKEVKSDIKIAESMN